MWATKIYGVMYGDCMLVGCRLRRERTEFKASLDDVEERKQPSFGLHSPVQSERQWVLPCTLRSSQSYWLCPPLFCMSGFLTLAIEFRKKQASLNLLKGKNDFLKIIVRQYFALDMGTFTIPKVNITKWY